MASAMGCEPAREITTGFKSDAICEGVPIQSWTSASTTEPSSISRSKLPPTASLLETWRQLALHEDTMSSGNVELLGDNVEILEYEPEGEAPTAEQFPAADAEDESPPMPMVFTVDNLLDNIATATFLSRPLEMPAEGVTFHEEDKLATLFAWAGIKQLVRAHFPPPHTVAFGHIYHTPYLAKLPPSSRQSVFQLLFALRRATFHEGPQGTSVVTQDRGFQLPLARAASTNDSSTIYKPPDRPLHALRMVLERTRTSVGRRLRCPRAGRTVGATGIRRPRAGRTTTTAPPILREGAASEITGDGEPWGTSLPGLRRRAAIAGAGVGAQNFNSAPILRLGVGAAGAEAGVGETRLRLGVAATGARTRAGAIAGRPALTAVAAEKGDGGQATVAGK
ncbi:unnamed protein product [Ectocarpus sp. CCAP 1310/34]|nr:unnamed protein product [Ectocarpus sp. CCAP 1310/34]